MYWTTLAMALRWAEYFFLILCIFGLFLYFRSTPHLKFSSFSPSFYLCFGSPIFLFYYIQFSSLPPLLSFLPEVFLSPSFSTLDSFSRSHTISCAFSFIFRKHPFWPYRNMFQCGLVGTGWGWRWTKKVITSYSFQKTALFLECCENGERRQILWDVFKGT